jgi:hypothetical protein
MGYEPGKGLGKEGQVLNVTATSMNEMMTLLSFL